MEDKYKTIKTIGRGSFGRADLVQDNANGKLYVMKVLTY